MCEGDGFVMCGILGVVSKNNVSRFKTEFENAIKNLSHRGPDHTSAVMFDNAMIGYTRLAIRGLNEKYNQPVVIDGVYGFGNGEVYFRKNRFVLTDKIDLWNLFNDIVKGEENIFEVYDADFAICCYDSINKQLILGRDVWGVKPLYISWIDKGTLVFASEIAAILPFFKGTDSTGINPETVRDYLLFGYPVSYQTFYDNIDMLEPGTVWKWNLNDNTNSNLWQASKIYGKSDENIQQQFEDALCSSVRSRSISDRNLGCHLSGGFDSSMLVYLLYGQNVPMKCFNMYREQADADFLYAGRIEKELGIELIRKRLQVPNDYTGLIKILNSPIMSTGAFVPLQCAETAKENHITVMLEGQGADELLRGYSRFMDEGIGDSRQIFDVLSNADMDLLSLLFDKSEREINIIREFYLNEIFKNNTKIPVYQEFYIKYFLHELLRIEDHVNMAYSIENRVPYLSLEMRKLLYSGLLSPQKENLRCFHKVKNTSISTRKKENMNPDMRKEIMAVKENYIDMISENRIALDLDYEKLTDILVSNQFMGMGKKEIFLLWFIYNVHLWCVYQGFDKKIFLLGE